jgi:hypothetical protein
MEGWTALSALVALGFSLYTYWHQTWRGPKLRLDFKNDRDVKTQINTVNLLHGIETPHSTKSRWLRVMVVNAKGRAAKNCRAYLIGIKLVRQGGTLEDRFPNDVRPMVWTHEPSGKPSGRDLLPGVAHWVDVAFAIEGEDVLHVSVEPACQLTETGVYEFTVQVSAEEASPKVINIKVHWDGNLHSLGGQEVSSPSTTGSGKYGNAVRAAFRELRSVIPE